MCTLIEESEELDATPAQATYESLQALLPGVRVGLVHGRLKASEQLATMVAFKAGEIDLLVATTVIEVGVDVPNASLMVIENAERLGLAQLHQPRGRVGRGSAVSRCVLLYQAPLSQMARERLQTMRETNDGFVIAEKDLELRGPGELLGTRQTGWPVSASPTWPATPGCCPACTHWPSACWSSSLHWLIGWCSDGSAPPCATPRRNPGSEPFAQQWPLTPFPARLSTHGVDLL